MLASFFYGGKNFCFTLKNKLRGSHGTVKLSIFFTKCIYCLNMAVLSPGADGIKEVRYDCRGFLQVD